MKQPTTKASSDSDGDVDRGSGRDSGSGSDSDNCGRIDYIFIINEREKPKKKMRKEAK